MRVVMAASLTREIAQGKRLCTHVRRLWPGLGHRFGMAPVHAEVSVFLDAPINLQALRIITIGRASMEQILINLIAGAAGGVGAGKASPTFDLGMIGNIIAGLVGGGVLGQIVTALMPAVTAAAAAGNLSIGGIISQVIAGGAGGAILTAIIGAMKNRAAA
jgi:hypothetical protein